MSANDNEAVVRIVGDATKVAPAINEAKAQVQSLASAATATSAKMREAFSGVSVSAREMGIQVRETFVMMGELREAMMAFGEVMLAAFAVEAVHHFAESMGEAAEKTVHLAQSYGMTTAQVQQLGAVAAATGINVDTVVRSMGFMDRNLANAAAGSGKAGAAFKMMGISINDGLSNMEKLEKVADKFKEMADGPQKTAIAMQLFGRAGAQMIPILNLGSAGIHKISEETKKYGIENQDAVAKGFRLAEAMNENKVAMMGLSQVMTQAFAPTLTGLANGMNDLIASMIQSYESGGVMRTVFEGLVDVMKVVETVFTVVHDLVAAVINDAFVPLWTIVKQIADDAFAAFNTASDEVSSHLDTLKSIAERVADVIVGTLAAAVVYYGVTGAGVAIKATYEFAMTIASRLIPAVTAAAAEIRANGVASMVAFGKSAVAAATEALGAFMTFLAANPLGLIAIGVGVVVGIFATFTHILDPIIAKLKEIAAWLVKVLHLEALAQKVKDIWSGGGAESGEGTPGTNTSQGYTPTMPGAKGHKERKPKDDAVQKWDAELSAAKTAFAMFQQEQGTYESYSLAEEAKFWAGKIKLTQVGSKDREEVEKKWLAAVEALRKEGNAKELEGIKAAEAANLEAAKQDAAMSKIALQSKLDDIEAAQKAGQISAQTALAEKRDINRQLLQLDIDLAEAEKSAKLAALAAELAQEKLTPQEIKAIHDKILVETKVYDDKIVQLNAEKDKAIKKGGQDLLANQRTLYERLFQGFADNIGKMIALQQGFATTFRNIWQGLQTMFAQAISNMVRNFIVGLLMQEAAEKSANQKSVLQDANKAARGAYNAVVGIPVVGPVLAPIAAATAFAAVEAFSAEGGDWQVKQGLYKLHENEMVLPAWAAGPLRNIVAGNDNRSSRSPANPFIGSGNSTNEVHIHLSALDTRSGAQWLRDNKRHVAGAVDEAVRQGFRSNYNSGAR